jgi:N-methylhydantoinase A
MIIGLDVGGTHTDVVLIGKEGLVRAIKETTDTSDLFNTVLKGLDQITRDIDPKEISRIVLSTTLTTNAVVQNKISPVGMIVSSGPGIDPEFFRTNQYYYAVAGSIDHRGRVVEKIREREIETIIHELKRASIQYVGVVSKFSVKNSAHELEIAEILSDSFEKVFLGHKISGNLNFPRRIATTYLNAAVYPVHRDFFESVKKSLFKKGLTVPLRLLKADGGNMNFEASLDVPSQTILSGPAASVMGCLAHVPQKEESLVLDIGGTTTDMAILVDGVPLLDPRGIRMGNYKTQIRSLKTLSIGVGGDSFVRVASGVLKIGPQRLGPAMMYGGPSPTPTDAMFALGLIDADQKEKALDLLGPISRELGVTPEAAAGDIFDHTCKRILAEAADMIHGINSKPVYTVHEMLGGHRVNPKKMLILGGPAPYFAGRLEELSDFSVGVIPRWRVANAIGAALARTTSEVSLFVDTEQGIAVAPEENFSKSVTNDFSMDDALELAYTLLKAKALKKGANPDHMEMEIVEKQQFNMVRGFRTTGRNIRVSVQIKPGLIHGYDPVAGHLV